MSKLSVIIRVKNEADWIGHAIQSCIDHLDDPQIIVIDNCSTDDSIMVSGLFRQDPSLENKSSRYCDVKVENIIDYSPGRALNLGASLAVNKYILNLSSHCVIQKFCMDTVISSLSSHKAVFGKQIPKYRGKKITPRYIWSHFGSNKEINMFSQLEDRYFFHNAFSVIDREFLLSHPFDEDLVSKEDRYWAIDLVQSGHTYLYSPELVADHHYTQKGNTWKAL